MNLARVNHIRALLTEARADPIVLELTNETGWLLRELLWADAVVAAIQHALGTVVREPADEDMWDQLDEVFEAYNRPGDMRRTPVQEESWVRLVNVLGTDSVPAPAGNVIGEAVRKAIARGDCSAHAPWQAIEFWAASYLAGD